MDVKDNANTLQKNNNDMNLRMIIKKGFLLCSVCLTICLLSCNQKKQEGAQHVTTNKVVSKTVPTVCLYTLGNVSTNLREAMLDSLKAHYPKCKYVGNIALDKKALTIKIKDHVRYRADLLNEQLKAFKLDTTIVIGLTQADIGLDNFRNRPHSGIMGLASGIGTGVAVFSSYRPHDHGQLFSVMLHEIGHTQGLRHCPDTNCMMQNAKGGNPFAKTNSFCAKCKMFMKNRHWIL